MSQATVLVVEDDPAFQAILSRHLHKFDYTVHCTANGKEGVKLCQQLSPDVVLCDLSLPDISGLQVIEALQKKASDVPVIVVSASESMSDIHEAVRLGAWDYLLKPLDSMTLINETIQECLNRHQMEDDYLLECLELDDHLGVLYQDQRLLQRLKDELLPQGPLQFGPYRFDFNRAQDGDEVWLDFRLLTEGRVMVLLANAQTSTGQNLFPLLIFKTLLDPMLRQHLAGGDQTLLEPDQLLSHLNHELCNSQTHTVFDALVGIFDTGNGRWCWAQAGDRISSMPQCRVGLALGIWQQASYQINKLDNSERVSASLPNGAELRIVRDSTRTS
ncbi:response regulator [Idiomarina seosinensis]|uniref:response regulator n=1 Tax=Idiomarina seosinensis TaxID=281739 RepID=UPI003850D4DE